MLNPYLLNHYFAIATSVRQKQTLLGYIPIFATLVLLEIRRKWNCLICPKMLYEIQSYANLCKAQMHSRNSKLFNVQYCVNCNCMPSAETMQSTQLCSVLNYAECKVRQSFKWHSFKIPYLYLIFVFFHKHKFWLNFSTQNRFAPHFSLLVWRQL